MSALVAEQITHLAIFLIDEKGSLVSWNPGVEKIIGYSRSEFIGRTFSILFTPEDIAAGEPQNVLSRAHPTSTSEETGWRVRKDGSRFWCDGMIYALKDARGRSTGHAMIVRDATARKVGEAEYQHVSEQSARRTALLNAVLASMPDAVYVGDETGITECNERAVKMIGLESKTDLNRSLSDLTEATHTRSAETNAPITADCLPFARALRGQESIQELSMRRVDTGEELIVRSAAAPVWLDGKVVGAVAVNADITHEKRIEHEREELLVALRRSNEELSQFAYVVSHDLQAPLRAVTGFTQLLQRRYENQLDSDAHSLIASVLEGTQNMNQLIHAVLQYARAGQQSPSLQSVSLSAVIDAVSLTLSEEIKASGAQVIRVTEMPVVETDWVQITQVFQNLISNALRYRRADVPPVIRISASTEEAEWLVMIEDNGIGIDRAYFQKIFEPLKRLHGREVPGTGIGLAICRKVLERFGGRIWVESQPGVGSKFWFTLPR